MRRFLLAPDSFKGTMSAVRVCDIMAGRLLAGLPGAQVHAVPMADGGEGTCECFRRALGGEFTRLTVTGPYGVPVAAAYLRLPDGVTAVVEMAAAAGLPLAGSRREPEAATTYGVGELIGHALAAGCRHIILGLGGSATNDGGAGMAAALGAVFTDRQGKAFVPAGGSLSRVAAVDWSRCRARLDGCRVTAMCDVVSPLCGPEGASAVFGPQKGADAAAVARLDRGLAHLAERIRAAGGPDVRALPGGGAAGGLGAGAVAFLGAELRPGIETVCGQVQFDRLLAWADCVLTGEGRLDGQSARGKVIGGVARRAAAAGVPVIAVVGDIADDADAVYAMGVTAVLSINRQAIPFSQASARCEADLGRTVDTLVRLLRLPRA